MRPIHSHKHRIQSANVLELLQNVSWGRWGSERLPWMKLCCSSWRHHRPAAKLAASHDLKKNVHESVYFRFASDPCWTLLVRFYLRRAGSWDQVGEPQSSWCPQSSADAAPSHTCWWGRFGSSAAGGTGWDKKTVFQSWLTNKWEKQIILVQKIIIRQESC